MQSEKYRKIAENIEGCSDRLFRLSDAFQLTGNDAIACKLQSIADCLRRDSEELTNAIFEDIEDQFNRAREASQNVLNGAIAGVEIAKSEPTDEAE